MLFKGAITSGLHEDAEPTDLISILAYRDLLSSREVFRRNLVVTPEHYLRVSFNPEQIAGFEEFFASIQTIEADRVMITSIDFWEGERPALPMVDIGFRFTVELLDSSDDWRAAHRWLRQTGSDFADCVSVAWKSKDGLGSEDLVIDRWNDRVLLA
jgi:hypothetical protein